MRIHILMPDTSSYGLAIFIVYGLSSFDVANRLRAIHGDFSQARFLTVYTGVLALVCAGGA